MALPKGLFLDISVDCDIWKSAVADFEKLINTALGQIVDNVERSKVFDKFSYLELGVVLCDDGHIQKLNSGYRNQDKATNVLSFAGLAPEEIEKYLTGELVVSDNPHSLGEIYVAYGTAKAEASEADISLKDHFVHLIIHGILHLLGYDHIKDEEAEIMEAIETNLLKNLGIDDPYTA